MDIEKVKITVIFDGIIKSDANLNSLHYHRTGRDTAGRERTFSATVIVRDENLLSELKKLKNGTQIEIETATDWDADGLPTELTSFREHAENKSKTAENNRKTTKKSHAGKTAMA